MEETRHKPYYEYLDGTPAKMKPCWKSPVKYLSSDAKAKTGTLYVQYAQDEKLKRKSWSWHMDGRSHAEAYQLAEQFLESIL